MAKYDLDETFENIVEKRRNCWLPAFSPSPAMFSKGFFIKVIKTTNYVLKDYINQI